MFTFEEGIFRTVNADGVRDLNAFLATPAARAFLEEGSVVASSAVTGARRERFIQGRTAELLLEHDRIPFPSYPAEWPPEMLHEAARLTLDLARRLLPHGIGLKDATPYNVLFRGAKPVFIDVLSFERREAGDSTWVPYGQFLRTFLLPLLVNGRLDMPLDSIFATRRDGLEPEDVLSWIPFWKRLLQPYRSLVTLPAWLAANHSVDDAGIYRQKLLSDHEKARYILDALFGRLERLLAKVAPQSGRRSAWSDYAESNNNYGAPQFAEKEAFVGEALAEFGCRKVLDAGCNTGHFSVLAARTGADVTAIDYDPVVVGALWRRARAAKLTILPLVVNLARPTPATGWNNRETPSFLDRARGHFDAVLLLALIHHLLVTERIPLEQILELAAGLLMPGGVALVEFVGQEDSMFRRLVRGRDRLYGHLTRDYFEATARSHFEILRTQHTEGTHRWIYLLRRR